MGIENKQYIVKIEQRNAELLQLKMTTGKTLQVLNAKKKELNDLIEETNSHKREIAARREQLDKIKEENQKVANQMAKKKENDSKIATTERGKRRHATCSRLCRTEEKDVRASSFSEKLGAQGGNCRHS